jgi:HK97 family phage major capsid protein
VNAPTIEDLAAFHGRAADIFANAGRRRPALYPGEGTGESAGDLFVRSTSYQKWLQRFPGGGPAAEGTFTADPVPIEGGFRSLITSADASAGTLVRPDYRGLLEPGLVRPPRIRDLLTILPTSSDAAEYTREVSRVAAAAPVAEATAATGSSGLKPEGGLAFELKTAPVRTFAVWVPATKRIVSDAPALRAYVDSYLLGDLLTELEDQIVAGSGAGENFLGIINTPTVGTAGPPAGGQSMLHVLREGLRKVKLEGRTNPTAIAVHPTDGEAIDLLQVNNEPNHFVGPGPYGQGIKTVWGVPVIETDAIPEGFALVGDFRRAVLFDREQSAISIGTAGDDFLRNIVRVLAEARAGFAVVRPTAFVIVDLVA